MPLAAISESELQPLLTFAGLLKKSGLKPGQVVVNGVSLPCLDSDSTRYIFTAGPEGDNLELHLDAIRAAPPASYERPGLAGVVFSVSGRAMLRAGPAPIALGVRAFGLHQAAAQIVGLPTGWQSFQTGLLEQTLEPLREQGAQPVRLRGVLHGNVDALDAATWLHQIVSSANSVGGPSGATPLVYVRAEAGKGKSILLATLANDLLSSGTLPLPIFVPLRLLAAGRGVSWQEVMRVLGVVGDSAARVAAAVRAGIIVPLLDGIDEVAGRYDPALVRELLGVINTDLRGSATRVVLSGRATEAAQLDETRWRVLGLELPEPTSIDFSKYASSTVRSSVPHWPDTLVELPNALVARLSARDINIDAAGEHHLRAIENWIALVFEDFGRDRSLFFVQSLAGLGRDRQLSGNQPLVVGAKKPPWRPFTLDVCLLAAAMACVRERTKVEELARSRYTADAQLRLLTGFALCSAATGETRSALPRPNELARLIFDVDPVNANELFTVIVRQNQKHALLFSSGTSAAVGDWRPDFLSAWIRSTLLVWAWLHPGDVIGISPATIRKIVATAPQSRLAFSEILPDLAGVMPSLIADLVKELLVQSANGNADASSNHLSLWAALSEALRAATTMPSRMNEGADLSDDEFSGLDFGPWLSTEASFMNSTVFEGCTFDHVVLKNCDLTGAQFSQCVFRDVIIETCDGPIVFEDCSFHGTRIENMRSHLHPAATFRRCHLGADSRIVQTTPAFPEHQAQPVCAFEDCDSDGSVAALFVGEWLGIRPHDIPGLVSVASGAAKDQKVECLRAVLRPFFPRWAGVGSQLQTRGYIRLSALGRGAFPKGAPVPARLRSILESIGFTTGGRTEHIYAPWASVNGAGDAEVRCRNELLAFLTTGTQGPTVESLLKKIAAEWR